MALTSSKTLPGDFTGQPEGYMYMSNVCSPLSQLGGGGLKQRFSESKKSEISLKAPHLARKMLRIEKKVKFR